VVWRQPYQLHRQSTFVPYPGAPGDVAPNVCYAKISRILEGRMTSRDEMLQTIMRAYKAREEGDRFSAARHLSPF
jgi:hypothetical protein